MGNTTRVVINTDIFKKKFRKNMYAALGKVGREVVETAKDKAPIDVGTLRDDTSYKLSGSNVYIGNKSKYAQSQEFGTGIYNVNGNGTMPVGYRPQPFLRPAINENIGNVGRIVAEELGRGL